MIDALSAIRATARRGVTGVPTEDLVARLSADAGVTTGATFAWADQVGSADAVQSTALDQPVSNAPASVDFDGFDHWLDWTGLTTGTSWTALFAIDTTGRRATGTFRTLSTSSGVEFYDRRLGSTALGIGGTLIEVSDLGDGQTIYTVQCSASSGLARIWRDGAELTAGGSAVTPTAISGDVGLMGRFANGNTPGEGALQEVLIYDAAISDAQRDAARAYLVARWV